MEARDFIHNVYQLIKDTLAQHELDAIVRISLDLEVKKITIEPWEQKVVPFTWLKKEPENSASYLGNGAVHALVDDPLAGMDSVLDAPLDDADDQRFPEDGSGSDVEYFPSEALKRKRRSASSNYNPVWLNSVFPSSSSDSPTDLEPFQPKIHFPKKNGRRFQMVWYIRYPWLSYSPKDDVAFCYACQKYSGLVPDAVFTLDNWKHSHRLPRHDNSKPHCRAMDSWNIFRDKAGLSPVISPKDMKEEEMMEKVREMLIFAGKKPRKKREGRTDGDTAFSSDITLASIKDPLLAMQNSLQEGANEVAADGAYDSVDPTSGHCRTSSKLPVVDEVPDEAGSCGGEDDDNQVDDSFEDPSVDNGTGVATEYNGVNVHDDPEHLRLSEADGPSQPKLKAFPLIAFGDRKRRFRSVYYQKHPWLSYSVGTHSATCFPCRKYGRLPGNGPTRKIFTIANWRKTNRFAHHETQKHHIVAMLKWITEREAAGVVDGLSKFINVQAIRDAHESIQKNPKIHYCKKCGIKFEDEKHYKDHKDLVHQSEIIMCPICGLTVKKLEYRKHKEKFHMPEKERIPCDQCEQTFKNEYTLKSHIKFVHNKVRPFQCDICSKNFGTMTLLKRHQDQVHDNIRMFKCDECGFEFHEERRLMRHKRGVHMKLISAACNICHKTFLYEKDLKLHLRTHAGVKPYLCPFCPAAFSDNRALKQHAFKEHGKTISGGINKDRLATPELSALLKSHLQPNELSSVTPPEAIAWKPLI